MSTLARLLSGKRFGLVLSAGFFGFYGHAGFARGLFEAGLLPSAWAGTSAGGLIAAFLAGGMAPARLAELLVSRRRDDFWDPDLLGILSGAVRGGHAPSGLLKGDRFHALLRELLPVGTFADCAAPLVLVAANLEHHAPKVLTRGELARAVHATCAYPGLFRAVRVEGALCWDGGLVDKAPALALADAEAGKHLDALVVHYLPSRTEPKVKGPLAYAQGMAAGMASLRREHFRLQLEVLAGRSLPVYVVVSNLPKVSPTTMSQGGKALDAGHAAARAALAAPPRPFEAGD